jgi:hypothetical protein
LPNTSKYIIPQYCSILQYCFNTAEKLCSQTPPKLAFEFSSTIYYKINGYKLQQMHGLSGKIFRN